MENIATYLEGSKLRIRIIALISVIVACSPHPGQSSDEDLRLYILSCDSSLSYDSLTAVVRISEHGCLACNRAFARVVQQYSGIQKVVFVISAGGQTVDISPFFELNNVIQDSQGQFSQLGFGQGSLAIFLNSGRIDTIVSVEVETLDRTLDYVPKRLNVELEQHHEETHRHPR
jgi:hypothetical protein